MNDDVGAGDPGGEGASPSAARAVEPSGEAARRSSPSHPALESGDGAARRVRAKAMKIPDDDVPPPIRDDEPTLLRPMKIIELDAPASPAPPTSAPPIAAPISGPPTGWPSNPLAPPVSASKPPPPPGPSKPPPSASKPPPPVSASKPPPRPNSKIPPAPGTTAPEEAGWTPGALPLLVIPPADATPTQRIEELDDGDVEPESEPPPAPRGYGQTRPDLAAQSVRERLSAITNEVGLPPPPPPSTSNPTIEQLAPPPPRQLTTSRPSLSDWVGTPPPPIRPLERSNPPPAPPPRTNSRPPPNEVGDELRMRAASEIDVEIADATPLPGGATAELAKKPPEERASDPGVEIEDIDVSLGDTSAEEPPGLAKDGVKPPPLPPPRVETKTIPQEPPKPPPAPPPPVPPMALAEAKKPRPTTEKRRARPWWEEMFDDDFLRSVERLSETQIMKESTFIEDKLGLEKGAVILDLACGAGRHAIELTSRGYKVVGYDLSLAMLARAQDEADAANEKVNFLHGDMREMAFDSMFDGVYCWGMSFGFFDEEKNFDVMQRVFKALRPGGVFLLDVNNRDFIAPRQPNLVWFEGEGCVCMDETNLDFITSRLKVKRTLMIEDGRTREIDYSIRLYGLHELGKMLHDCGFKVLEVSGSIATPGVYFGSESPRTIILAERG